MEFLYQGIWDRNCSHTQRWYFTVNGRRGPSGKQKRTEFQAIEMKIHVTPTKEMELQSSHPNSGEKTRKHNSEFVCSASSLVRCPQIDIYKQMSHFQITSLEDVFLYPSLNIYEMPKSDNNSNMWRDIIQYYHFSSQFLLKVMHLGPQICHF